MTNQYSDDTKAAVVAALMTGQSVSQVAKDYNIPKGTVSSWKNRGVALDAVDATQKSEIGDLLLDYLRENLATLRAQAVLFRDIDWLKLQDASAAAVLHGVMTDKAVRLLEALSKNASDDPATSG